MRFGDLGPAELLLIAVALVLVFGAGKLGDIGGALGRSVREFKQASRDDDPATTLVPPPPEQPPTLEQRTSDQPPSAPPPERPTLDYLPRG